MDVLPKRMDEAISTEVETPPLKRKVPRDTGPVMMQCRLCRKQFEVKVKSEFAREWICCNDCSSEYEFCSFGSTD